MKAVRFYELGGPDVLRIEDVAPEIPSPGEVRIKVEAIGLNRSEVNFRRGEYLDKVRGFPSGLGYEAAGVVDLIGPDVDGFAVGDPVSVLPSFPQSRYHTYAEFAVLPAVSLIHRPDMNAVDGAAVWMPFLTAYGAMLEVAELRPGDHLVITAASSSVGLAAIQVARRVGAVPIATTNRPGKAPRLMEAGAHRVVVTGQDDIVGTMRELTDGRGAQLVFDAVAGSGLEVLAEATAEGGLILIHGSLSGELSPMPGLNSMRPIYVRPYTVFEVLNDPERRVRAVDYINEGFSGGAFRPVIDRIFELDDIVAAHRYLEGGDQTGKVVVTVS